MIKFSQKYDEIIKIVQNDIVKIKKNMIMPISVISPLNEEILAILNSSSKYIRSVVSILYLRANNINLGDMHYELLSAIELVHNASLIHDDVIDECSIRRNHETLNTEFSSKLAVIAGDYILSLAMQKIAELNFPEITDLLAKILEKMSTAEINQYFEKFKIPTIEQYLTKSNDKTAELFVAAVKSCNILSGIKNKSSEEFAKNFGIAFQIRDDLMNVINLDDTKPVNNDIECGIYTAPVIFAGNKDNASNGIEKTKLLLNNYIDEAINAIGNIEDNIYKRALIELSKILKYE